MLHLKNGNDNGTQNNSGWERGTYSEASSTQCIKLHVLSNKKVTANLFKCGESKPIFQLCFRILYWPTRMKMKKKVKHM